MKKVLLVLAAAIFCASSAFAVETAIQTDAVQDQLKSTDKEQKQEHAQQGKEHWQGLSDSQKDSRKSIARERRSTVHNARKQQIEDKNQ